MRLRGLRTVFVKHDKDGSGNIDATEFGNVMTELGVTLTPKELADALQSLDKSGDGIISFDEYRAWFDLFDMQLEFSKFDSDGSGLVNKREFLSLLTALGLTLTKKERDKVFGSLDHDGSGLVSFAEFHPWFKAVREQTKKFVLNKANAHWEDELFLERHDNAEVEARSQMRVEIEQIADEIEAGRTPSRQGMPNNRKPRLG